MTELIEPRQAIKQATPLVTTEAKQAAFLFWYEIKDQEGVTKDVKIDNLILIELLYYHNFRRFDVEQSSIFIKLHNNRIISQTTVTEITDFVFDYIDQLPDELPKQMIKRKLLTGVTTYFNEKKLYLLKPKEPIELQKDTISTKFIYFKNGFLNITKKDIKFMDYKSLSGYIWDKEIIQRDYVKPPEDEAKNYVKRFFSLVAGPKRFNDLCIAAGYYTHDFYDYKLSSLVITDSGIDEENEANGRTGKTLFCKIIAGVLSSNPNDQNIKTYVEVNAKDFDSKAQFKYASCGLETKLVVLNDLRRHFDVDCLFNDVTEGIDVNKKGLAAFKIRCKIILTTNKTIKIEGDSAKDRFLEFEFTNYFSASHTPENEFKHWFFRDWNNEDYCRYYLFMAQCTQMYFSNNLKLNKPTQITLNKRKLRENTAPDFLDWIEQFAPVPNHEYEKRELYEMFVQFAPDYRDPKFKQRKFSDWLKNYCNFSDHLMNYRKDENERRTSTTTYFKFIPKDL
jgi:hypothetical protein